MTMVPWSRSSAAKAPVSNRLGLGTSGVRLQSVESILFARLRDEETKVTRQETGAEGKRDSVQLSNHERTITVRNWNLRKPRPAASADLGAASDHALRSRAASGITVHVMTTAPIRNSFRCCG